MKTPKRKHCSLYPCDKCGRYGITFTADDTTSALYQCSLCGACWHMPGLPRRTRAIRARWIRKNREARLRNALENQRLEIIRLSVALDFQRRGGKAVKEEYLKHLHIAERAAFCGTYGQEIEGS